MNKKDYLKAKADAFEEVGQLLKYDYEGAYDRSSIESFFDDKAEELKLEANTLVSLIDINSNHIEEIKDETNDVYDLFDLILKNPDILKNEKMLSILKNRNQKFTQMP